MLACISSQRSQVNAINGASYPCSSAIPKRATFSVAESISACSYRSFSIIFIRTNRSTSSFPSSLYQIAHAIDLYKVVSAEQKRYTEGHTLYVLSSLRREKADGDNRAAHPTNTF